jgi:GAF domain-containing protein
MPGDRLARILGALEAHDGGRSSIGLCEVSSEVIGVSGTGIMLMSRDVPRGSLCTTNAISALIEELQYTLGEGPCIDAYQSDQVVLEPDLADPRTPRWLALSPRALQAGARALFGFPLRVGAVRLGALNLYQDRSGPLSDDQHADALVMADVVAHWVLDVQSEAPPGVLADELQRSADFHFVVHNAAGIVSIQLGVSVTEALIRLRAHAFGHDRPLRDVAQDVVNRKLQFG